MFDYCGIFKLDVDVTEVTVTPFFPRKTSTGRFILIRVFGQVRKISSIHNAAHDP